MTRSRPSINTILGRDLRLGERFRKTPGSLIAICGHRDGFFESGAKLGFGWPSSIPIVVWTRKREITWHSGLTIASNARNGIEMRAPSRLRNCKSSKKSPSDAKRSGIRAMCSRRGSKTDQNPEGSIDARGALGTICELGSSSSGHFSPSIAMAPECKGTGVPVPLGRQPSQACPVKRSILARWRARDSCNTFTGHSDVLESIRRFRISTGLIRSVALKSPSIGFVVSKSKALASCYDPDRRRRIARFLIWNIAAALRSKVMWLIAENRARSIPRRSRFNFGCTASAILSTMFAVLLHLTSPVACQERSPRECALANGDFRGDAQPAIFTSTSGSRRAFRDTNLGTEELLLPFGRRLFHQPITRARTWNLADARV